ncbi:MAG: HepT-like ribonuclease domain-containing protein, partial [Candidatus Hydrogenedentales bacterium]
FTDNLSFYAFTQDRVRRRALERVLEIIGEAARRVSEPFCEAHTEVPWRKIIAKRNVLIHEYDEILEELLWKTAREDAPALIAAIAPLLPDPPRTEEDRP